MTTDARSGCVGFVSESALDFAVACGDGPADPVRNGRTEPRAHPYLNAVGIFTGGKIFCRKRRSHSSHSGNWSLDPSDSRGSSAVNPGGSVAISNNTSPGSLK